MSELSSDVGVPEQPLEDEHSQTQGITVALQRDQLPIDRLRTNNIVFSKCSVDGEETNIYKKIYIKKNRRKHCCTRLPRAQSVTTAGCMKEAS